MHTPELSPEFREQFEEERTSWLRRRAVWYYATLVVLAFPRLIAVAIGALLGGEQIDGRLVALDVLTATLFAIAMGAVLLWIVRQRPGRRRLLGVVWRVMIFIGAVEIVSGTLLAGFLLRGVDGVAASWQTPLAPFSVMLALFITHFIACCFLPWTPREAMRPIIPLLLLYLLMTLVFARAELYIRVSAVLASPLVGVPGVALCWWRHSRYRRKFEHRMTSRLYKALRRELLDARAVHESLLPDEVDQGPVLFQYAFEPMQQIGGDFVFCHVEKDPEQEQGGKRLTVVLVDVTGHGVAAALAVNRLSGELERLAAENGAMRPAELIRQLNTYVATSLGRYNMFATALAVQADVEAGVLRWCNAGHPPGLRWGRHGEVARLEPKAVMLGVVEPDEYDAPEFEVEFDPGDAIVMYTDGAAEVRDENGDMLGPDGVSDVMTACLLDSDEPKRLPEEILARIHQRRAGAIVDDVLIVSVFRPLRSDSVHGVPAAPEGEPFNVPSDVNLEISTPGIMLPRRRPDQERSP